MLSRKWTAAAVVAAATAAAGIACGPFFPWQLLDDRPATLKTTPVNSFTYEAQHIVAAPKDGLREPAPDPDAWYATTEELQAKRDKIELSGLYASEQDAVKAMRAAASGPAALAAGQYASAAVRLYTAGAVAWHKSDFAFAGEQFSKVLLLDAATAKPRIVWASYMLGRIAAAKHDDTTAAAYFQRSRALALKANPDPFGLAVASFGEEARLHFNAAQAAGLPPGLFLPQLREAIRLYGEQAARGSTSGVDSLRMVAEYLFADDGRIQAGAHEPLAQKLMVAYALKRLQNNIVDQNSSYFETTSTPGSSDEQITAAMTVLAEALEREAHPAGADRLAALCYNLGRWKCAQNLSAKVNSPLAAWIGAKLAVQKGDLNGAAALYAKAARGFPTAELEPAAKERLNGEGAVVALARGEYVDALDKLMPFAKTYWPDVSYIAERVLTADELKTYVDAHVPAVKTPPKSEDAEAYSETFEPYAGLRDLLARRLMREGRTGDAFAYFKDDKTRQNAVAYDAALREAKSDWGRVDQAEALFKAATLARGAGMEMMGTEGPPDSFYTLGDFEEAAGRSELKGDFVTAGEHQRFDDSTAKPALRFHYRYVAIDAAVRAADLLPARSQAFAAVLCHATAWSSRDEARAKRLYERYVKEGARVPFAKTFGATCPAPDFAAAIKLERKIMVTQARAYVSHHRWWFLAGGLAGLGAIALLVLALTGNLTALMHRLRKASGNGG